MAGSPKTIVANSTPISTGRVEESMETEEERTFAVKVDHVLKGSLLRTMGGNRL